MQLSNFDILFYKILILPLFQGDMGATPLFYAIMQNNTAVIEMLREKGAKIDTTITFQDEVGTILHFSCVFCA